jgi:hypothetical protein
MEIQDPDHHIDHILVAVTVIRCHLDKWLMLGTPFDVTVKFAFELEEITLSSS